MIVRNWMQRSPTMIHGDLRLAEAEQMLTELEQSALPVVEDGRLRGLLTRQHCLRSSHFVARTQSADEYDFYVRRLKVKDVMCRRPATIQATDTMEECLRRGQELGVGQFPVLDGQRVVGVIGSAQVFLLAAHFLGAWEKRSGLALGPMEVRQGTIGRIADLVEGAGAEVLALYPITQGAAQAEAGQSRVIVRFRGGTIDKVTAVLSAAGFPVMETVDAAGDAAAAKEPAWT
jgi:acetoin utilization protein AcuB